MTPTYKIAVLNNYISIVSDDLPDFEGITAVRKDIRILTATDNNQMFEFWNLDGRGTKWNTLELSQILDENGDPFTLLEWTTFYTTNTGNFSTAGGGSSVVSKKGIVNITPDPGEQAVVFLHGLPGANWVNLQYSDPEFGDIYLADVQIIADEVSIVSDNTFPSGNIVIFYEVAIIA